MSVTDKEGFDEAKARAEAQAAGEGEGAEQPGLPGLPPAPPEKPKRRRRTKAQIEAEKREAAALPAFPPEVIILFLTLPFEFAEKAWGEHWKLSKEAAEQAAPYLNRVLTKRLPDWAANWGDEIALGTILGVHCLQALRVQADLIQAEQDSAAGGPDRSVGEEGVREEHLGPSAAERVFGERRAPAPVGD